MNDDDEQLKKVVQVIMKIGSRVRNKEKNSKLDEYFKDARLRSRKLGGYI